MPHWLSFTKNFQMAETKFTKFSSHHWKGVFRQKGWEKNDRILFLGKTDPSILNGYLACLHEGIIPAFISYSLEKTSVEEFRKKLKHMKSYCQYKALIGFESHKALIQDSNFFSMEELQDFFDDQEKLSMPNPKNLFMQFTSGSTGSQKGMLISLEKLEIQLKNYGKILELTNKDKIISWLPLYHDMGLISSFFLPLYYNISAILMDPFAWVQNPKTLFQWIEKEKATLCWMPNFAFQLLCDRVENSYDLSSIRSFISCAEPVLLKTIQNFESKFQLKNKVSACYAMAENVFAMTQSPLGEPLKTKWIEGKERVSCGKCISGTFLQKDPQTSELILSGESLFDGFFHDLVPLRECNEIANYDDRNRQGKLLALQHIKEFIPPCPKTYKTGDIGEIHQGEVYVIGRTKDLIITRGKNVFPGDIESWFETQPDIIKGRTVALGIEDLKTGTEEIYVLCESRRKKENFLEIEQKLLYEFNSLHEEVRIEKVKLLPPGWLLKTSSGKIARKPNLEKYLLCQKRMFYIVGSSHADIFAGMNAVDLCRPGALNANDLETIYKKYILSHFDRSQNPQDLLLLMFGEIDIRTFALKESETTWKKLADIWIQFFKQLRTIYENPLAWLVSPPQHREMEHIKQTRFCYHGSVQDRLKIQWKYVDYLQNQLSKIGVSCIFLWDEFLDEEGFLKKELCIDGVHILRALRERYFSKIQEIYGDFPEQKITPKPFNLQKSPENFDEFLLFVADYFSSRGILPGFEALSSLHFVDFLNSLDTIGFTYDKIKFSRDHFANLETIYSLFASRPKPVKNKEAEFQNALKSNTTDYFDCVKRILNLAYQGYLPSFHILANVYWDGKGCKKSNFLSALWSSVSLLFHHNEEASKNNIQRLEPFLHSWEKQNIAWFSCQMKDWIQSNCDKSDT